MAKQALEAQQVRTPQSVQNQTVNRERTYVPATDIIETPDHWLLYADMPGVDARSLDVTVERDTLTIDGRVSPSVMAGHELAYAEYGTGNFHRSFTLSGEVDRDGIEALIKNGVLRLTLPKGQGARAHKVTVRSE
jgi:HSP20 family molecular chaperone IbpA